MQPILADTVDTAISNAGAVIQGNIATFAVVAGAVALSALAVMVMVNLIKRLEDGFGGDGSGDYGPGDRMSQEELDEYVSSGQYDRDYGDQAPDGYGYDATGNLRSHADLDAQHALGYTDESMGHSDEDGD